VIIINLSSIASTPIRGLRLEEGAGDFGETALCPSCNSKYDSVRSTSLRPTGAFFSLPAFATLAFSAKKKTTSYLRNVRRKTAPDFVVKI